MRYVQPDPIQAEALGDSQLSEELSKGAFMVLAHPWDEDEIVEAAAKGYEAEKLQPNHERVQKMTRGFLKRFF